MGQSAETDSWCASSWTHAKQIPFLHDRCQSKFGKLLKCIEASTCIGCHFHLMCFRKLSARSDKCTKDRHFQFSFLNLLTTLEMILLSLGTLEALEMLVFLSWHCANIKSRTLCEPNPPNFKFKVKRMAYLLRYVLYLLQYAGVVYKTH